MVSNNKKRRLSPSAQDLVEEFQGSIYDERDEALRKYRQAARTVLGHEDTIDDLKQDIRRLTKQSKNHDKEHQENQKMKQLVHDLEDRTRRLERDVHTLSEDNENLQSENDKLKESLSQKDVQLAELQRQIDQMAGQNSVAAQITPVKSEHADEEAPQADFDDDYQNDTTFSLDNDFGEEQEEAASNIQDDYREMSNSSSISDDYEDQAKEQTSSEFAQESVDEVQQGDDSTAEEEDAMEEEEARSVKAPKNRKRRALFTNAEDICLIDFIFNITPAASLKKDIITNVFWGRASAALIKANGNERDISTVRNRLRRNLVKSLHLRKELTTENHRKIAKICYEFSFNDRQTCEEYMAKYDEEREKGFVEAELPTLYSFYTSDEIDQIIDYMFNKYEPPQISTARWAFSSKRWLTPSSRLKTDTGSSRSPLSLRDLFRNRLMFELYQRKELHTPEHREIAVLAFQCYGRKWIEELTEQYDKAKLPGTTDEQIAQMESLAWRREAEAVKRPRGKSPKHFSSAESNKLIELVFKTNVTPSSKGDIAYWDKISAKFPKNQNYARSGDSLKLHFQYLLLPTLHKRKQLHTPVHRQIAVELYKLWLEPDMSEHHIQLYDSKRQ